MLLKSYRRLTVAIALANASTLLYSSPSLSQKPIFACDNSQL